MAFIAPIPAARFTHRPRLRRPGLHRPPARDAFLGASCRPPPPPSLPPSLRAHRLPHPAMVSSLMPPARSQAPAPPPTPPSPLRSRKPLLAAAAAAFLLAVLFAVLAPHVNLPALFSALNARVAQLGVVRGAVFLAAINFCAVLFCFPANMGLMIGAGAVLGPLPAFLALFTSKLAAAAVAFSLARGVLYQRATRWLQGAPKLKRVLSDTGREGGWKFVVLMRLSPFPGFLLNYLLSLTGIGFAQYLLGTLVGIVPSISNLVLVGATAKDVSVGVGGGQLSGGWLSLALKLVCMVSMLVVSIIMTRRTRRAFAELDENGERKIVSEVKDKVISETSL